MSYTPDLIHELNALMLFDPESTGLQGIKVHKTANPDIIAAVERLYAKGLISQPDGGYLTALGRQGVLLARNTLDMLTAGIAASIH